MSNTRFATLAEALQTNLIFFDYGQVLGTQIEDAFDATTRRLLDARDQLESLWRLEDNGTHSKKACDFYSSLREEYRERWGQTQTYLRSYNDCPMTFV